MIMQAKSPDSLDYDASVGCPSTLLYCVWCYCSWVSSKRRCFCGVDRQCLPIFDHRCVLLHWGLPLVVRTWTRAKALRAPHSRGSPNLSRSLIGRTISWAWNQPYNWKKIVESFVIFIELRPHHALASAQIWAILSKFAGDQRDDTSLDDWWEGNARSWSFLHVVPDYACFKGASSFKHLKTQKLWIILNLYFVVLPWLSACVQSWFHHFDLFSPCQQCVVVGGLGIWLSNGRPGLQI
jgi:hypothetical protein